MHSSHSVEQWSDAIAAGTPTPGGGSAAAIAGALAAALVTMVARLTTGRDRYRDVEPEFRKLAEAGDRLRSRLLKLAEDDLKAFAQVGAARALPRSTDAETRLRALALDSAWIAAARVPLEVVRAASEVARLARRVAEAGNQNALGEAGLAVLLAAAAARGSFYNVQLDLEPVADLERREGMVREARELVEAAEAESRAVASRFTERR